MGREIDLEFGVEEALWRRIELKDVSTEQNAGVTKEVVKPNKLRLQISTVRAKHGNLESVPYEKWNGVAEARAGLVAAITHGPIEVACIDEPTKEDAGHALIAMFVKPGGQASMDEINAARMALAKTMTIVVKPTKV